MERARWVFAITCPALMAGFLQFTDVRAQVPSPAGSAVLNSSASCVLTISCPPDMTIECDLSTDPVMTGTATYSASAECGAVTLTYSDAVTPGACPEAKTIARTWTAASFSGDVASCVQTITVQDTKAPGFQCPSNLSVKCLSGVPSCTFGGIGALDNCGGFFPVVCSRADNGGHGCLGDPLIFTDTYTTADNCGNATSCQRTITVVDDVAPILTGCPPNQTIECASALPLCDPGVTASDNCNPSILVSCSDGPLVGGPCGGAIARTYRATDPCGNTSSCTQIFTVNDDKAPVVTTSPDIVRNSDPGQCGATVTYASSALDNCQGAMVVDCNPPSGSFFSIGTTIVTCSATDACGNAGGHIIRVTIFSCRCHHDPICDSITNILDVQGVINVAFRAQLEQFDTDCQRSREDVDCNGYVDIIDVTKMVNVAFRGADPATEFCEPCP